MVLDGNLHKSGNAIKWGNLRNFITWNGINWFWNKENLVRYFSLGFLVYFYSKSICRQIFWRFPKNCPRIGSYINTFQIDLRNVCLNVIQFYGKLIKYLIAFYKCMLGIKVNLCKYYWLRKSIVFVNKIGQKALKKI